MGYDFLMAMKMGLAAVDPLFTFWAHSYTHRYYRCGWPRRQCYGCSYTQLQLLHLLQKRERMKERERACVNYRLVCLLVGVSVCVCVCSCCCWRRYQNVSLPFRFISAMTLKFNFLSGKRENTKIFQPIELCNLSINFRSNSIRISNQVQFTCWFRT